eukprot:CAMPEP_0179100518 /NCGR_PEP_ID=MMETSP0796-20121207/46428_1 /TAXON_ID=73915 /ORGANISM="Pyrodinium bahamense, Strain pbaha01" /LENGTH=314 /DNA_ID=CAMNT_0020798345 /DNA_START=29 /DNA_END=973 /DNA_ORIENTATION=+
MVTRQIGALAAGAYLVCHLVPSLSDRSRHNWVFITVPASLSSIAVERGSPASPAPGPRAPAAAAPAPGATAVVAVALMASASLVERRRRIPAQLRCWSRVTLAGKKRGGGGKGGGGGGAAEEGGAEGAPEVDTEALMKDYQGKMQNTLDMLRQNLSGIRAGRATPALLEGVTVEAYESQVSIKEVGTITATDTTTLQITCFDETVVPAVEKAIMVAALGYSVQSNGPTLKVGIPPLTKEKRTEYAKLVKDFTEKSKVAVRNVRQAALKKVKGLSKSLSEDVVKSLQSEVESMVKKNIADCEKIQKAKDNEIMNG